ncbi:MAG TPA: aminotransferase class V-fold PLP-dependent enzyme [Candidatus Dormibacteraeota bacterium]|nr:aminotransferase class V-fold PLP-dependent enzyme [Candidatus Dormibacteraeota bacterium]
MTRARSTLGGVILKDPLSAAELERLRARFPILATGTYLANHTLGAMPVDYREALTRFTDEFATRGVRAWTEKGWWDSPTTVGDMLAPLLGAPPGSVVMLPNVTVAEWVVASCFDWGGEKNRVVYEAQNFPSVMYVWEAVQGAEVVTVEHSDQLIDAIDERTLLVPISHVQFKTAHMVDVEAIVRRANEVGAHVVLDTYQSAGAMPLEYERWGISFGVGGSVKWLCGGPGGGYLYVRPDLQNVLRPRLTGWQAHARPFAFEPGAIDYTEGGMLRYAHGTPAVPALVAAGASYRLIDKVGVDLIRARSLYLTQHLIDRAQERGVTVNSETRPERRGASVVIKVEDESGMEERLAAQRIIVDSRPGAGVRCGPHVFNTIEELDTLLDALAPA